GLDEGATLGIIYHVARKDGIVINIKISVPKDNPKIKTITNYFAGAEYYEREIMDLLGAEFEGLPKGIRYPLPDGWPGGQYPLRKDWKSDMLGKENNNG
ncbi:MAG: NADH-quinone oxidoreductase subunit C, partial [Actinobacteria bacterium]|nr:NADH-quinone oxidoreductase subunit C [Actinomycetota bacterium]